MNNPEDEKNKGEEIALLKEGKQLFSQGNYKSALLYFDQAQELDPDNGKIWDIRGVALSRVGLQDEAQESFEVALDLEPDNASAWSNLGTIVGSDGATGAAIYTYRAYASANDGTDSELANPCKKTISINVIYINYYQVIIIK